MRMRLITLALLAALWPAPASAVDSFTNGGAPDLTSARNRIAARDWAGAITVLNGMVAGGTQNADVYNLLGYSLRNSGDTKAALTWYKKALDFDPDHKGALEYLGELHVMLGDLDQARGNEAKLVRLCPQGCEELDDLRRAIAAGANP